ncbi:hypothetical protein Tco_1131123 [Tanacetum coccineum]
MKVLEVVLFQQFDTWEINRFSSGEGTSNHNMEDLLSCNSQNSGEDVHALNWHKQFLERNRDNVAWQLCTFEALLNKVEQPEGCVIRLFNEGLKEDIGLAVRMFKPSKLADVYKTSPGHKCSGQMYCLEVIACNEEIEDEDCVLIEQGVASVTGSDEETMPQISLNAMTEVNNYQTKMAGGHVGKQLLHILVDCGSTHNFLDLNAPKRLRCKMRKICPLQVYVANGQGKQVSSSLIQMEAEISSMAMCVYLITLMQMTGENMRYSYLIVY